MKKLNEVFVIDMSGYENSSNTNSYPLIKKILNGIKKNYLGNSTL